tara:strand:+ start:1234 stop:1680 length:447 start_codon:yes stop_codon:yes gene_type:complete
MKDLCCHLFYGKDSLFEKTWKVREKVFIHEQNVPIEIERDACDETAWHLVLLQKEIAIGTGRLFEVESGHYAIGRVAILKNFRHCGYGKIIMNRLLQKAWELCALDVELHAQKEAIVFYEKLGFVSQGDIFKEAGIDHITMKIKNPNI